MRVLVTGAAGFTGRFLMAFLAAQGGVKPVGLVRSPAGTRAGEAGSFVVADLRDRAALDAALATNRPDAIIHLAGMTRGNPEALHAANVTGTRNLLGAAAAANPDCRVLVISSSAVYGSAGNAPIPETAPLRPVAEYGRSKVEQEAVAREYAGNGLAVAIARPFNLAGPGQPGSFVCGSIVKQVLEIEQEKRTAIELYEIVSARDLVDVRDVVAGYWSLIAHPDFSGNCAGNAFNLGSGNAYPLSQVVMLVEEITGTSYKVRLPEDSPEIPVMTQCSDNAKILALTGWKPEIPLKQTLADMLAAARDAGSLS